MPSAENSIPPHQQNAATMPALRGPDRSSQPPQVAAESPSTTKNSVYIHPRSAMRQSHVVVKSALTSVRSGQATESFMPIAFDRGSQKTLKPYAMPIQRWMASAAGG